MPYTVRCEGLVKRYRGHTALAGLDLAVEEGSVYGLLGPNGAGKTTLVRVLATLTRPDAGTAEVAGHDLLTEPRAIRRAIGLTGQDAAVDELLSGRENLEMMAQLRKLGGRAARRRAGELLAELDLEQAADRRAGTYSGGMRRRLDLAVSMIERPRLLFLDEPTTGLDPRSREQVWGSVRAMVADGVSVLLTTQYLEEADRLADVVGVLDAGRIVAEDTPERLKATLGSERVRLELADAAGLAAARAAFPHAQADTGMHTLTVTTDGTPTQLADLLAVVRRHELVVVRVETVRPSLDDVFLALTDRRPHAA